MSILDKERIEELGVTLHTLDVAYNITPYPVECVLDGDRSSIKVYSK